MTDMESLLGVFPPLSGPPLGEVHYIHVHVDVPVVGTVVPVIYCSGVRPIQGTGASVEQFIGELRTKQLEVIARFFQEMSESNPAKFARMIAWVERNYGEFERVVHSEVTHRSPDTTCEGCARTHNLPYEEYLLAAGIAKQLDRLLIVP